jgi:hypothetical protein
MSSFRVHFSEPGAMPGQTANSALLSPPLGCCGAALAPRPPDTAAASIKTSDASELVVRAIEALESAVPVSRGIAAMVEVGLMGSSVTGSVVGGSSDAR